MEAEADRLKDKGRNYSSFRLRPTVTFSLLFFVPGEDSSSTVDYRNAALKFPSLFHFGVVKDPPFETLSIYRLTKIPSLLILLAEVLSDGTPRVRPILYDEKPNGPLKYPNIVRFFYLVHKKYFKELPGSDNPAINLDVDDIFEQHFKEFPETLQPPNIQNKQINNGENKNKEDKNIDKDIDKERTSIVEDISEESPIKRYVFNEPFHGYCRRRLEIGKFYVKYCKIVFLGLNCQTLSGKYTPDGT